MTLPSVFYQFNFDIILTTVLMRFLRIERGIRKRRYSRLPLTSELDARFTRYANPCAPTAQGSALAFSPTNAKQKTALLGGFAYGGEKGIRTLDTG